VTDTLRVPPHSTEAEQSVLGGLMLAPERLTDIAGWLSESDFYRRDHALIYRAICELAETNQPCDAVTMGEWFEAQGIAELVGGSSYILELANNTPSAANIVAYADIVREKSALRTIIDVTTETAGAAFVARGQTSKDLAAEAVQRLMQVSGSTRLRGARSMADIGKSWFAGLQQRMQQGGIPGIPTPWGALNAATGGLQRDQLIILAGRPGSGKTAAEMCAVTAAALAPNAKGNHLVFSLEMSAEQLYSRAACALTGVNSRFMREPDEADDVAWSKISTAVAQLRDARIIVDDTPGITIDQLKLRARREHMRSPLAAIWIDHLHIMGRPGKTKESTEYGDITRELKGLAKSLGIPVNLLCQLSRKVEERANKRPIMSDLRESGAIEQDADVILFLYRDDYYVQQGIPRNGYQDVVEIIISKGRDIETGTVYALWNGACTRIEDMEHQPGPWIAPVDGQKSGSGIRKRQYRAGGE